MAHIPSLGQQFLPFGSDAHNSTNDAFLVCISVPSRMDKDGSLSVDWDEWRQFFQLYPKEDLESMVQFWRQSLVSGCRSLMEPAKHSQSLWLSLLTFVYVVFG